jgi:hypothetical protein
MPSHLPPALATVGEPATRTEVLDLVGDVLAEPPTTAADLVDEARRRGARPEVVTLLQRLPDRRFHRPHDLWEELPEVPLGD